MHHDRLTHHTRASGALEGTSWVSRCGTVSMSVQEFRQFSALIYDVCGIKMTASKKTMLEARLQKRLRSLNLTSFREYAELLFQPGELEKELCPLVNAVTTNKTEFFREPAHFDFLVQRALPEILKSNGSASRNIALWSAGCSTGEEPYTLAMILSEYAEKRHGMRFSILATDISTSVLERAHRGIYPAHAIAAVPPQIRAKYLLKSKDRSSAQVMVVPALRKLINFSYLNFMDEDYGVSRMLDIIFCRNVIIYFDMPTQKRVLDNLCRHLAPGGYLFMGHSETLSGLNLNLVQVASTVYRKPQ